MKFLALNINFSNLSPNSLSSRKTAHAGVKEEYPVKSRYLTTVGSFSVNQSHIDKRRLAAFS